MYNICKKLTDKGVILVSAFDNSGAISYPAAFENVIGVISGPNCKKSSDFEYMDDTVVNVGAKGGIQRIAWKEPNYILMGGNSFACAYVTAQTVKLINSGLKTRDDILSSIKNEAINRYESDMRENKSPKLNFSIKKAVIFPFNKEMHSIIRYSRLLNFDVVGVYDSKYSPSLGSMTTEILKDDSVLKIKIDNVKNLKWDSFDTLIIGHTDKLSSLVNQDQLKKELIETALFNKKNVYSFDELDEYNNVSNIYFPTVNKSDLPLNRFGMLYRISKPIVSIFGTSSKQGKFTLQLKMREILLKQGYSVGQIGTEPSSLLFGMDYVFPMGYNSSVHIDGYDTIRYLNHIVNDLCVKEKDIILVGSQSGTIHYDTGNITMFCVPQYEFLLGTQPDISILCVNPYDDIEYIRRTINFIQSVIDCKIISIVVFPMDIHDNWAGAYGAKKKLEKNKFIEIKSNLTKNFNIPIYNLDNNSDIDELVNLIINFFS